MTAANNAAKTMMVLGILCLWASSGRPGLGLLGAVLIMLVGLAALAGIVRVVGE